MRANSKSEKINIKIPSEFSGLFYNHYDQIILLDDHSHVEVLLLSMFLIENENKKADVDISLCKKYYIELGKEADSFSKVVYDAKRTNYIKSDGSSLYFKIKGIKKIEEITGQKGKTPVYIIKSGENFTAIKRFEEFLVNNSNGDTVNLCDSHISEVTLFPFTILKSKINSLKILTANIYNPTKFNNYVGRMQREFGISIEVKENKRIHDRFIIFEDSCWIIGTSIKDLGNKDSFIREISEIKQSVSDLYDIRWNEA